ncbi:OmpA family protein [uncultured Paraglaciecola sp.]|uniref:OmpA family protein n=1 Tax=uncultured Paraglaciecola sp. TaxID=1765024 RepID=UPI00261BD97F|nr:OmpA family protein [uncultured Paraglaciecola sp.]
MKKLLLISAIALAFSANVHAQQKSKNDYKWVTGFGEYYKAEKSKEDSPKYLNDGFGGGVELGFQLTPEWAARIEASYLEIDVENAFLDEPSSRVGADALYFLSDDMAYVFGGLKLTKIHDADVMANIGLGKHWDIGKLGERWDFANHIKLVTEVAAYQSIGSSNSVTHMGLKLGLAYAMGGKTASTRPKDADNDGVSDKKDQCLDTPTGIQVDANGCTLDDDKDGIINRLDNCPNTSAGTQVDSYGCVKELDEATDSLVTANTLQAEPQGELEQPVTTSIQVLFAHNSAVISDANYGVLQKFASFMERFPTTDAVIEGHASAPGSESYNLNLSQKRANSVRTLLINEYGIDAKRITAIGFGESQLLDTSNTAAADKVNRRITAKVSARSQAEQ